MRKNIVVCDSCSREVILDPETGTSVLLNGWFSTQTYHTSMYFNPSSYQPVTSPIFQEYCPDCYSKRKVQ